MTESGDSAFWAFSLKFYRSEEVQAALLALQDRHGADVNVLLYVLHRAEAGDRLSADTIGRIDAEVAGWRGEVVQALRAIRRRLKPHPFPIEPGRQEELRTEIKRAELNSEKLEQLHLEALDVPADGKADPAEAARTNLDGYATLIGAGPDAPELPLLLSRFDEVRSA